jgi:DNA-binding MarR family transcriptional regulator
MVRHSDKDPGGRQGRRPDIDFTRPLPPEPRPNIGALLDMPKRAVDEEIVRRAHELGYDDVRPAHGAVFAHVAGEGSRLTDLAERAMLTKQSMQYLVDDLERLGYVERVPDPADRRAKLVRLTPRGRESTQAARESMAAVEADWQRRLGKRKMAHLRQLLEELAEELRDEGDIGSR